MRRRWLRWFDQEYPDRITAVGFDQLTDDVPEVQLIVNSTSSGLNQDSKQPRDASREAPDGLQRLSPALVAGRLCYDLSYGSKRISRVGLRHKVLY